tara:strand:- start:316 stop:462 length:147 start_codon:yes stop_codon:yes gene_type:complete
MVAVRIFNGVKVRAMHFLTMELHGLLKFVPKVSWWQQGLFSQSNQLHV